MRIRTLQLILVLAAFVIAAALTGCASKPKPAPDFAVYGVSFEFDDGITTGLVPR